MCLLGSENGNGLQYWLSRANLLCSAYWDDEVTEPLSIQQEFKKDRLERYVDIYIFV